MRCLLLRQLRWTMCREQTRIKRYFFIVTLMMKSYSSRWHDSFASNNSSKVYYIYLLIPVKSSENSTVGTLKDGWTITGNIHFRISRGVILKQGIGVVKEAILVSIAKNIIKRFCCQFNKQNWKLNDSLILASAHLNTARSQDRGLNKLILCKHTHNGLKLFLLEIPKIS